MCVVAVLVIFREKINISSKYCMSNWGLLDILDIINALPCVRKITCRNTHRKCSVKIGVLKNFAKFTRKHLRRSFYVNKVVVRRPTTLLKKRLKDRCFLRVCKIFKNAFSIEHLRVTASATCCMHLENLSI